MKELEFPSVTIGIVVTRVDKYEAAIRSAKQQIYPSDIEVFVLDNQEKDLSIGAAYNKLADECEGEWIMFLGDDDEIVPEYILSLMSLALRMDANPVCVTSHCTLYDETSEQRHYERIPTGMWKKSYIMEKRFNEDMPKYVDSEFFDRANKDEDVDILLCAWQAGYFYQQHKENVSGNKIEAEPKTGKILDSIYVGSVRDLRDADK